MAKKRNKKRNEGESNSLVSPGFFGKLFSPVKVLLKMHLRLASIEFKKDKNRFVTGIATLFIGLAFIIMFWLLLNVIAIVSIYDYLIKNLLFSLMIVAGGNLIFSLIFLLVASKGFKKPFLKETTKMLKETIDDLK